ncbi:histidine phosphatase family protein [Polynucleobacter sp. 86C-FISCH]|uniref:histidine phosphatase family protein n=1 Tax=Polynucleobacter sp. 86C-FISCH TaxID=2689101 RepID=UPI001C0C3861|nr:histidine phosphatase family protein [Polynucleobacter sp. 86C-FISCH]MBU3595311.1 histidine phosphatase family protein [Polynucleobacter sp. 86C-FISCH]
MKIIRSFFISTLLAIVAMPVSANLASSLSDGQHVLLMRHADAPGYGDPVGYQLDKCSTQRNLGDRGKRQAILIGQWLSNQGITSAKVLSSPWCRCIETAKLLNKGQVNIAPALGSFFDDMSMEKEQTRNLEKLIQAQLTENPKMPIILVTHHVNIQAFTGKVVNVGEMVLAKVDKNGKFLSQQIYPSPSF